MTPSVARRSCEHQASPPFGELTKQLAPALGARSARKEVLERVGQSLLPIHDSSLLNRAKSTAAGGEVASAVSRIVRRYLRVPASEGNNRFPRVLETKHRFADDGASSDITAIRLAQ